MRVGLYGGTFDPVHFGHINLALALQEYHALDAVWVIPTSISPFKEQVPGASAQQRLEMTRLGFSSLPNFSVLDLEVFTQGPVYTIDTVRTLQQQAPQHTYYLLLGEDAACDFVHWKEAIALIHLAAPLIGARIPASLAKTVAQLQWPRALQQALHAGLTPIPQLEISATAIRARIKKSLYCGHLQPSPVLAYIQQHRLYM